MNTSIWAIGLILQCLLLGALARRGMARRLPLFTALVGFYVVRSVFLFAAFGHLSTDTYSLTYQALSLMDIVFQVLVAWELFSGGRQYPPAPAHSAAVQDSLWRRLALFSALLVGSASDGATTQPTHASSRPAIQTSKTSSTPTTPTPSNPGATA